MSQLAFVVLVAAALVFTRWEQRSWGSGKTPFAFTAYPLLGMVFIATFLTSAMGFLPIHAGTILSLGFFLALVALTSIAVRGVATGDSVRRPLLESMGSESSDLTERGVGTLEYLLIGGFLAVLLVPEMLAAGTAEIMKGELGAGSLKTHTLHLAMAYLLLACSQRGGQPAVRLGFALLVLWILAFNQVKYLIMLPLAGALLYRWVSGLLSTWKLAVIALVVPLGLVVTVYGFFSLSAISSGMSLTPAFVMEVARHMVSYLVAGTIGFDQLLALPNAIIGPEGLEYAFAPFVNIARFVAGAGDYVNVVNPLSLPTRMDGTLDSNVFTLFGSVLFRGGWVAAVAVTLTYFTLTYVIWDRWRMRVGTLACAVGSWWMAPLLFAWHDPFFIHLSIIEVAVILWLRNQLPAGIVREWFRRRPRQQLAT